MGQGAAWMGVTQFFLYGKKHFTRIGYETAAKSFTPNQIEQSDCKGKTYMITGANSGLGLQMCHVLAKKGAIIYMVCRDQYRGQSALEEVLLACQRVNDQVYLIIGDCAQQRGVRHIWAEFTKLQPSQCLGSP